MTYDQISPAFRQALGAHEGFRKLGFLSADIYVHRNPNGEMLVVLKVDGKQFGVTVGWVDHSSHEDWERTWVATAVAVRDGVVPQETMDRIWQESFVFAHKHDFVASIMHKGIKIPHLQASLH